MNVNKATIVGRLTRDPEVRTTNAGQSVTSFGLATNRTWKGNDGEKKEETEFHNIVLWGRLAEIAGQYLTKGQECYIDGRLQTRTYTGKDGVERRATEIVGENMQMGSRAGGGAPGGSTSAPRAASQAAPAAAAAAPVAASQIPEEEIPTINLEEEEEVKIEDVPF